MLKWNNPEWFQLIWLCLGLFFFGLLFESARKGSLRRKLGTRWKYLTQSVSPAKRTWHLALQSLSLIFLGLALARPLLGTRLQEIKQSGIELMIAVDVSNSMLAEDDKPSRLEHAKHEVSHFLDEQSGDQVGLIAFAGSAILISPITSDHSALKMFVNSLSPDSVSTQGTDFKEVVSEAIRAFDRGGVESLNGVKPTRVLLILSDGEDHEPGATEELKKATQEGIRVFALGFGSPKGAPIPLRDDSGNLLGYKKDKAGQVVMSVPSDEGLAKLAQLGDGRYYHSTLGEGEVKNLVDDFSRLEKADFKSQIAADYDEKFQIPLVLSLLLGLMDLMFGERKRKTKSWRGRFEVAP